MSLPVEKRQQWIKSRRDQRKLAKYARLRRQFLRYSILLSMLILGIVVFARIDWCLYQNKENKGIDISGNLIAHDNQVRQILRPEIISSPLFLLNPTELENRAQSLSVVKRAFIRRYAFPSPTLKVEILEEFPWATLCSTPSSSVSSSPEHLTKVPLTDRHGRRLSEKKCKTETGLQQFTPPVQMTASPAEHPLLTPLYVIAESGRLISIHDFPNVVQPALKIYCGNSAKFNMNSTDVEQWSNWIIYIGKQMQDPVLVVDMREPHDVQVDTRRFTLALGNPDSGLTRRLSRLASVLGVLANQHREPAYVNLGLNSNVPVKLAKKLDRSGVEDKISRL